MLVAAATASVQGVLLAKKKILWSPCRITTVKIWCAEFTNAMTVLFLVPTRRNLSFKDYCDAMRIQGVPGFSWLGHSWCLPLRIVSSSTSQKSFVHDVRLAPWIHTQSHRTLLISPLGQEVGRYMALCWCRSTSRITQASLYFRVPIGFRKFLLRIVGLIFGDST